MAEIVLDGVTKRYPDGTVAVHRMNLDVADGEFVILVGPSGCGKSTTLNMIAGLEDITEGELRVAGDVVNGRPPGQRDMAMVFQSYALYPHLTVSENLAFPLTLAKVSAGLVREKVGRAAKLLGITDLLDRRPAQLSGGQRQRVAMGRAIVRDPRAFLMDEPLSNLDARLRVQMRTQLARLQRQLGTTTVYVTHDQTEAMTLGDRVVVMRAGHVQQVGTPRELYETPANVFVAGFIGSPGMNFLSATVAEDRLQTMIGDIPLGDEQRTALAAQNVSRKVVAGLRPEAFGEDPARPGIVGTVGRHGAHARFAATVDVLEWLGADVFAHFYPGERNGEADMRGEQGSHGGERLVVRLRPDTRAREGEPLDLWIDPAGVHLFDPESGRRIVADA